MKIGRFSSLSRFSVFLLMLSLVCAATHAQEYDLQAARRLKAELWSIFERIGIQSTEVSKNLTDDQTKTLASIKKVNNYPLYVMTYHGDYGFDEFLKGGHPPGSAGWTSASRRSACSARKSAARSPRYRRTPRSCSGRYRSQLTDPRRTRRNGFRASRAET